MSDGRQWVRANDLWPGDMIQREILDNQNQLITHLSLVLSVRRRLGGYLSVVVLNCSSGVQRQGHFIGKTRGIESSLVRNDLVFLVFRSASSTLDHARGETP